jgi:predicted GIY-YIG superfamily endonuclease
MYCVYILRSQNKSYIGMTNDFLKRWMQHNRYIKGGAKYTTRNHSYWEPICIIDGFKNKSEAMQCEWKLKRVGGYYNRLKNLSNIYYNEDKWTSNSPFIKDQNLTIYILNHYKHLFNYHTKELFWF